MVEYEKSSHSINIICEETVRYSFVSHLSAALRREDISVSVFADTDLDDHNQGTRVSVVVFSENAFSLPWLNNFAKVVELQKNNGHEVIPVFYGVNPSVVNRNHDWQRMLLEIGYSGGHQSGNSSNMIRSDSELVEEIVRKVYGKLSPTERIGIYMRVMEFINLLCEQPWGVRSLGIWGMPGIGKTTLAKAVFDHISNDYDASCFIENFDEALHKVGPQRLLEEKMGKILEEKFGVSSSYITRLSLLKDKLCDTQILVVLDDVCNPLVAESFLGRLDWFGPGSLIIITSRYKQVFSFCQISQIYKVQGLNKHEALQLFSRSAFEKDVPEQNDQELLTKVIDYANGNPLALRIYGQELKGKKSKMEAAFLKLKQCPPQKILDRLKSVYSALGDNEKYIFLDIACFFKGENVNYVVQLLKGCGYFPRVGIDVLVEKCLVTISENTLHINDLIQDIFREIIVGEKIQMEGCTTLWQSSSIRYLLEHDELKADGEPKETPKCLLVAGDIKGISLDTSNLILDVYPDAFKKMVSLRFLKVYNSYSENVPGLNFPKGLNSLPCELRLLHWENYPFESLPQGFDLRELVELNMPYSQLKNLCARTKNLKMLKRIKLCHSLQLVNFSIHAQNIELISLQGCTRLESFLVMTKLQHLRVLNLSGCINIKIVPELPLNIEELYLQGTSIEEIPISIVARSSQPNCKELMNHIKRFPGLEHIDLDSVTNLIKVSSYNQGVGKLVRLNMKDCFRLRSLPDMFNLESLQVLDLSGCSSLEEIKGFPRNMKELYLAGTGIQELPEFPESLKFLNAHGCHLLKSVHLDFEQLSRHYIFSNCFNLSLKTTVDFLETGLTRVIRLVREQNQEHIKVPAFNICFPADVCQRSSFHWQVSSFAMVVLAPCMRKALSGFAMSVSVSFSDDCHNIVGLGIRCICTWKTRNGHSDNIEKVERVFKCWSPTEAPRVEKDHIFVFYDAEMHPGAGEENDSNISDDEIKFEFHTVSGDNIPLGASCMVTECGVKVITGDKSVSKITRESETTSITEEENAPPLPREPEATSSVSKTTRESETMSIIEEEDAPPLPREPEVTSSVSKTKRESETMRIIEEEEDLPLPRDAEATSRISKTTRESETMSITEEENAPPLPREPEATSSVSKTTRESETMSIIEEEDAPPLPRDPEATSSFLSSSEPHKLSSMPSKVRSKRTVFWKWVGCFPLPPKNLNFRRRLTRVLEEALIESKEKGKIKQVVTTSRISKTTRESETMSITEEENAPPLPREPEATSSVSKTTRESETMSIIEEEDAPPLPREPEVTSSVSKTKREGETMRIIEEEEDLPLPRDAEATSRISKTTRESETTSITEEENAPPLPREPEATSSVSKTTRESETMSIIEEEDAPPLPREPEVTSSVSKTKRESETMRIIEEEEEDLPLPRDAEATSRISKTTRESETTSITEEENAPPLPREPEATSSVSKTTRESETMSIIEEEDAPPLPRDPEATSSFLSSSEPHKLSSMPSKVRSKRTVFWKWVGCFPLPPKNLNFRRRRTRVLEEALIESKEKGKIKQVADDQVGEKGERKHSKDHVKEDVNSICHRCNSAIEDGISVNAFGAVWHPQCLCCLHCQEPIAMHEIPHLNYMLHKRCYKEHRLRNCYVCEEKIPRTAKGVVEYHEHPFWRKKYCPSHDCDGTAKCCSCERLEHRGTQYVMLSDGRWLCQECMECVVMDTFEGQDLYYEIREFFEGLNMKIEKEFPLFLVEKGVMNKAYKDEKIDYQYGTVRGICLSKEQMVTRVIKGQRKGPKLINIFNESQTVVRTCEVVAILILYGLPRLLTGCILAHEMMHAWLRLNGYRNLNTILEEGLCQVLGHMWLESQTDGSSDSAATNVSSSFSHPTASISNNGDKSDFEKKLVEFCKNQIETDDSLFGNGFRKVNRMMHSNNYNLGDTLKDIISASKTIPDSNF